MALDSEDDLGLRMHAERTPNPNSLKWVLAKPILPQGSCASFESSPDPVVSQLAAMLFAIEGVVGVLIADQFVTVSKSDTLDWPRIAGPISNALKEWLSSGSPALGAGYERPESTDRTDLIQRIRDVIEEQIRPSLARDGGDIAYCGYRDGVVELQLQGACRGCPGAAATLEFAIEKRLREQIPEVQAVVAV